MSNKICPTCQTKNDSGNLKCIKCTESLIYVLPEQEWTEEHDKQPFHKNELIEDYFSLKFLIRFSIGITFIIFGVTKLLSIIFIIPFFIILLGMAIIVTAFLPIEYDVFSLEHWRKDK